MKKLLTQMQKELAEFEKSGQLSRAKQLAKDTNAHFNHNEYPMYFTGNPEAKFVLVHLNPKQTNNLKEKPSRETKFKNFDDYYNFHRNYGKFHYGIESAKTHKSPFDYKQIQFIKAFNIIDFDDTKGKFYNLEKVIDDKFQLELIPFGSDNFTTSAMKTELLKEYVDILLDTLTSHPREYIIFCGKIFERILKEYIILKVDYEFKLPKAQDANSLSERNSKFSKILITYNGVQYAAGIAQSYAQQGINMDAYGKKCHELYNQDN